MPSAKSKRLRKPSDKAREFESPLRLLFHDYVLEVMLANEMAVLPADTAANLMGRIAQLDGLLVSSSSPIREIAHAFSNRVVKKAAKLRAELGLLPGSRTQN
jgi:hypothetical protein